MRQWEIYDFPVPTGMVHPCVVISPDSICQNAAYEKVNVLMCVSIRADYKARGRDVRLNGEAGLDGPTAVKSHVHPP